MTERTEGKDRVGGKLEDILSVSRHGGTVDWIRGLLFPYSVRDEAVVDETSVYLDTFDGRLFQSGLACSKTGAQVRLYPFANPGSAVSVPIERTPRFAAELPEGKLRNRLLPVAKSRALLDVLRVCTHRRCWRILNEDQKTVARLVSEEFEIRDDARSARLGPFLLVKPVRGYERTAEEIECWLDDRGLPKSAGEIYLEALEALGKYPKPQTKGHRMTLDGAMPAAEAVRLLLGSLHETVLVNEPGVRADTDTEFLHDYRVAVRKARSLLGQTRGVFAPQPTAALRKSLSWLGRSSNALRDLDVYLLHRPKYESWLGSPLDRAIEPLFVYLEDLRDSAFREFVAVMASRDYARVLSDWRAAVDDPALLGVGRKGARPIGEVAPRRLARKCRQVLERGYELTDVTAPEALHALRIECKHLRYLVEFFIDFVPDAERLVQRMKKLQDALGAIQDLTVQEERLRHYLEGAEIRAQEAETSVATQELLIRVREERDSSQRRVSKLFARFNRRLAESDPPYAILLPWLRP